MPELSVVAPSQGFLPMPQPARTKKEPVFLIRPKHHAILEQIYKYQLLTNEQIGRVAGYAKTSIEEVQRLTKQLSVNGYVLVLVQPVVFGRAPYVYTLAKKGLNYLAAAGYDIRDYFRPSKETEKGYLFLAHTLALNDFLIAAANLSKFVPEYSLSSFTHERTLKQTPFKVKVQRYVGGMVKEETVTLIPDAYLDFRHVKNSGKEEKIPVLFELDRGTIERKNFQKKIRAYIEFIKDEGYKDAFQVNTVTVAFATTHGHKRVEQMRDWSRKEFAATSERGWLSDLFLFTALPEVLDPKQLFLEPVWYQLASEKPLSLLAE